MSESTKTILAGYDSRPTVKGVQSLFKQHRSPATHVKTGLPVRSPFLNGNEAAQPSEWDLARVGVWAKHLARRTPGLGQAVAWNETEEAILRTIIAEDSFSGEAGGEYLQGVKGARVKTILDDTTSGGSYLNPDAFDSAIIITPLLYGELLPFVDLQNVPRGSTVAGAAVGNPTVTWNNAEGSAQTAFVTTSLISSISHNIFPVAVYIEIGRDALADSAVDLGAILVQNCGQRFQAELDKVIAAGDGSTQPAGLSAATGVNSLSAANGTAGPLTVGDAEALIFGVGKEYRVSAFGPAFVMTDEGYRRFRSVAVNASSDARRVFGMDHQRYMLMEYPVRVSNDITEGTFYFSSLRKAYRLYKRAGVEVRFTSEGDTLSRKNCTLLCVRGRWGGGSVDGAATAKFKNGPTTG